MHLKIQNNCKNWLKRDKKGSEKFQLFFEVVNIIIVNFVYLFVPCLVVIIKGQNIFACFIFGTLMYT